MRDTPTRASGPGVADLHCIATRATLCFADDALDPDDITRRLGIAPTSAFRKGDARHGPGRTGRP